MQAEARNTSPRDLPDAELAARIALGNRGAFEAMMRRFNQPLFRTARSIVRDDAEAEDVLQSAYLHAYQGISSFRSDARLSTWLTRIVVNEAIAALRKRTRSAEVLHLHTESELMNETNMHPDEAPTPERSIMCAQLRQRLERQIDALPDPFRVVFVMRAVQEMSSDEVALCLDVPQATVRTRFHRARSLLREMLAREVDVAYADVYAFDGERCERIVHRTLAQLDAAAD